MSEPCVIYSDAWLLAADKPAGLLVHGDGTGTRTLTDDVRDWVAARGGDPAQVQAVQRLDVPTTGLVLFSLRKETQAALDAQVAGRADALTEQAAEGDSAGMQKRYLALVAGRLPARELTLRWRIGRDRHDARRMRVSATGKAALTRVEVLAEGRGLSLLAVYLGTGRRHQIRVHLAHLGHPILGDTLYGGRAWDDGLMLHAHAEVLTHPTTGKHLALRTAWPERFPTAGELR